MLCFLFRALEETQQLEVEKALVLANQGSVMWRQEQVNKFTRGQVVSEDLSQNVVAVCGVVLPRIVPTQAEQVCTISPRTTTLKKSLIDSYSTLFIDEPKGSCAGGLNLP